MTNYSTKYASYVGSRDGVGVELYDQDDRLVLQVYRDDETQEVSVVTTDEVEIPVDVVTGFIQRALSDLASWPTEPHEGTA
jgi:hypothetical protein